MIVGVVCLSGCGTLRDLGLLASPDEEQAAAIEQTEQDVDGDDPFAADDEAVGFVEGKRKIAVLLPLSGQYAALGTLLFETAQMALFDFGGENIDILPFDVGHDNSERALKAFQQAREAGAEVIAGPLFSASVDAIDDEAVNAGIPILAFSSDSSLARQGVFIMGYRVEDEIKSLVAYARRKGFIRYALLAQNSAYGRLIDETLHLMTDSYDANYTRYLLFDGQVRDASEQVEAFADYQQREAFVQDQLRSFDLSSERKEDQVMINEVRAMTSLPFDAVFLPLQGQDLVSAVAFLAFYDVTNARVRFLGTSLWESDTTLREPLLNGSWFAAPDIDLRAAFRQKFISVFQRQPPRVASIVYDTVALLMNLMASPEPMNTKRLTEPKGFEGVNGLFRLHEDGTVERSYNVYKINNGRFDIVGKGRQSFDEPLDEEDSE